MVVGFRWQASLSIDGRSKCHGGSTHFGCLFKYGSTLVIGSNGVSPRAIRPESQTSGHWNDIISSRITYRNFCDLQESI